MRVRTELDHTTMQVHCIAYSNSLQNGFSDFELSLGSEIGGYLHGTSGDLERLDLLRGGALLGG